MHRMIQKIGNLNIRDIYLILLLLMLPNILFLTNAVVWDDPYIFEWHAHWSWDALFGPYLANFRAYWRPLTVLTIAIPNLLGFSIWSNKLISLTLAFVQASLTLALLDQQCRANRRAISSWPLLALAILLALHPIFVESALWISARADLLMGIFVLLGILWITHAYNLQSTAQMPTSLLRGAITGFFLAWLACASKDTAIVWAGIGVVTATSLGLRSTNNWRRYWIGSASGITAAMVSYLILRGAVLGQINGLPGLATRHTMTFTEQLQVFTEFIIRSLLFIFLPLLDQAPFKSPGWFAGISILRLALILTVCAACCGFLMMRLFQKNKTSACMALCAIGLIMFHAVLTTFTEVTLGSLISGRYLAPSVLLICVILAMALQDPPAIGSAARPKINTPVALILGLLLLQSLLLWSAERFSWSTNLALWRTSWEHGSRSRIVAENYSRANFHLHDFIGERKIAQEWLETNQTTQVTPDLCNLYVAILEADVALADRTHGNRYANLALPIGWCRPAMPRLIAFFLLEDRCQQVLPVIYQAIAEGDKPEHVGRWHFSNAAQREQLQIYAARGEARCGDRTKAIDLLRALSLNNPEWRLDGADAQNLLREAGGL